MSNNQFTDQKLKEDLTPEEYKVLRKGVTESPFSGEYVDNHDEGMYKCKVCGENLFSSDSKFDSNSGWPSFFEVFDKDKIKLVEDNSHGMIRTEVKCKTCDSHLGHIFDDGPPPSGKRFCINSICLTFQKIN